MTKPETVRPARFTSILERSTNRLWGGQIHVPHSVAERFRKVNSGRVLCSLNDEPEYQCAIRPAGNGDFVVTINKPLRERLGLTFGTQVLVRLTTDKSRYGLPLPEEFRELLRQDREGNRMFHALTAGKQRTLLYIIGGVKDAGKRMARSLAVVDHLRVNQGRINYRKLYLEMKPRKA